MAILGRIRKSLYLIAASISICEHWRWTWAFYIFFLRVPWCCFLKGGKFICLGNLRCGCTSYNTQLDGVRVYIRNTFSVITRTDIELNRLSENSEALHLWTEWLDLITQWNKWTAEKREAPVTIFRGIF